MKNVFAMARAYASGLSDEEKLSIRFKITADVQNYEDMKARFGALVGELHAESPNLDKLKEIING